MAWTYDVVSWTVSLGEWRKWQAAGLSFVRGERVLEIAHGPGHMLLELVRDGRQVTGLDLSPFMGRMARRRLWRTEQDPQLVRGRVQALPFADQTFDTVYCTFPTSFITEEATMHAIYRVLRAGGHYIIVPEGHLSGTGPVQQFIAWLYRITGQSEDIFEVDDESTWPAENPHWLTFRQAMEKAGFEIALHAVVLARSQATVLVATRK
jgi:ubiquinone/menaquinone biosynthesis C-methylase UbiE